MKRYFFIALSAFFWLSAPHADAQTNPIPASSTMRQSWEIEQWTGDDKPFAKERKRLEAAPPSQLETILREGRKWAPNVLPQPLSWFRYGTAAYLLTTKWKRDSKNDLLRATAWGTRTASPRTPTFARLQFLLAARGFPRPELKNIGLRLAQRDARDYDVRYFLCKSLVPDRVPANKQLALRLCDEMQRLAPNRPSAYSARGSVYFRCWLAQRSEKDRQGALAAYTRYLQIAPENDPFRPQAQSLVAMMKKK